MSQQLKGFIAENRQQLKPRAGQAQRRTGDRRQAQGACAASPSVFQPIRHADE
ncbi:MCE-family Mce3C domain protein [Mycobacterium intracellulare]|nr:MCE-family Mce3C domain protein [Mycobacterium intracellulare]